jgi:hypothetical protein
LSNNKFSGSLPASFKDIKELRVLRLGNNGFTGTIPDVFNKVSSLGSIELQDNQFKGKLPDTMGELGALSKFHHIIPYGKIRTKRSKNGLTSIAFCLSILKNHCTLATTN